MPIQRLGEVLGVLVVQNREPREYTDDEVYALEVVAMVIAEMAELGAFVGPGAMELARPHQLPFFVRGLVGQEGVAEGTRGAARAADRRRRPDQRRPDPRARPAARRDRGAARRGRRDAGRRLPDRERRAPRRAERLPHVRPRQGLGAADGGLDRERPRRRGRGREGAVRDPRPHVAASADPYLRERLHDLDDLSNRLLRLLAGVDQPNGRELPDDAILVARNIGPGELLDYGRKLRGVVLEEGSVGSHAAIVARALAIPLVIQAARITREALNGDPILVDGDQGIVHLRPEENVAKAFREKVEMLHEAQAGLCGAARQAGDDPRRRHAAALHERRADGRPAEPAEMRRARGRPVPHRAAVPGAHHACRSAASSPRSTPASSTPRGDKPVVFRTLDIGSDKVLPYMKRPDEPNPALGWRAIRVGLDRPGIMRMQVQALMRGARGRPLQIMFPFVTEAASSRPARELVLHELDARAGAGPRRCRAS